MNNWAVIEITSETQTGQKNHSHLESYSSHYNAHQKSDLCMNKYISFTYLYRPTGISTTLRHMVSIGRPWPGVTKSIMLENHGDTNARKNCRKRCQDTMHNPVLHQDNLSDLQLFTEYGLLLCITRLGIWESGWKGKLSCATFIHTSIGSVNSLRYFN